MTKFDGVCNMKSLRKICKKFTTVKKSKADAELEFWKKEIDNYIKWYKGKKTLYGLSPPSEDEKYHVQTLSHSAILTWWECYQKLKYLHDLNLNKNAFVGLKLLDIGSGPMPSALAFEDCEVYALDPLIGDYVKIGFPLHYYERCRFISSGAELIPCEDHSIDAVISVNAIDHVDDFFKSAIEIKRILSKNGLFRMHVHYHSKTIEEPIELSDEVFWDAFHWCNNLRKLSESDTKDMGNTKCQFGEKYVLWSNFECSL